MSSYKHIHDDSIKLSNLVTENNLSENSGKENRGTSKNDTRVKCKSCREQIPSNQLTKAYLEERQHVICQACQGKTVTTEPLDKLKCEPCERSENVLEASDLQFLHQECGSHDKKRKVRDISLANDYRDNFTVTSRKVKTHHSKKTTIKNTNESMHQGRHIIRHVNDNHPNKMRVNEEEKCRIEHDLNCEHGEKEETGCKGGISKYGRYPRESRTDKKNREHHREKREGGGSEARYRKTDLGQDGMDLTDDKMHVHKRSHNRRGEERRTKVHNQYQGKEEKDIECPSSSHHIVGLPSCSSKTEHNVGSIEIHDSTTMRDDIDSHLKKRISSDRIKLNKHKGQSVPKQIERSSTHKKERVNEKTTMESERIPLHSTSSLSLIKRRSLKLVSKSRNAFHQLESFKKLSLISRKPETKTVTLEIELPASDLSFPYVVRKHVNLKLEGKSKESPLEIVVKIKKARHEQQFETKSIGISTLTPARLHRPPSPPRPALTPIHTSTSPRKLSPPGSPPLHEFIIFLKKPEVSPSVSNISFNNSEMFPKKTDKLEDKLMKHLDKPKGLKDQINLLGFKEENVRVNTLDSPLHSTPVAKRQVFGDKDLETTPTTAVLQLMDHDRSNQEIRAPYKTASDVRVVSDEKVSVMVQTDYCEDATVASSVLQLLPSSSATPTLSSLSTSGVNALSPMSVSSVSLIAKKPSLWKIGNLFKEKSVLKKKSLWDLVDLVRSADQRQSRDVASLRFTDEKPQLGDEVVATTKPKSVPTVYSGGVEPRDIGYNLHGSFYQPPTSWNKKVLFPPPDDTLEPTDQKVRVSERKSAVDFLCSIGYTREQAWDAVFDDKVHKLLYEAIREAHVWVNVIPKEQGMLLLLLAHKCNENIEVSRRFFHQLAEAIINCRITRAMQVEGYIEVLNDYIKGIIPRDILLDKKPGEDPDEYIEPKVALKRKTQQLFSTLYKFTKNEAGGRHITKDSNEVKLLRALVVNYSTNLKPHLKLLAQYIANEKIANVKQLNAAMEYLQMYKPDEINITHFEEYCL